MLVTVMSASGRALRHGRRSTSGHSSFAANTRLAREFSLAVGDGLTFLQPS
jgi:hypothetical protein